MSGRMIDEGDILNLSVVVSVDHLVRDRIPLSTNTVIPSSSLHLPPSLTQHKWTTDTGQGTQPDAPPTPVPLHQHRTTGTVTQITDARSRRTGRGGLIHGTDRGNGNVNGTGTERGKGRGIGTRWRIPGLTAPRVRVIPGIRI